MSVPLSDERKLYCACGLAFAVGPMEVKVLMKMTSAWWQVHSGTGHRPMTEAEFEAEFTGGPRTVADPVLDLVNEWEAKMKAGTGGDR